MKDLIDEYKFALKQLKHQKEQCSLEERNIYSGMQSDLEYALEWMQKCRMPGNRRGVERLAAYQREKPFDPILMQKYTRSLTDDDEKANENIITSWDKERISHALSSLTNKEREVYLMKRGEMLSFSDIASLLGLSKSTVQKMVERAENKIKINKEIIIKAI
ncbi:Fis family transcriptional regulator [Terribacillus saccharophilus]|uniref:Fis family transcriptional regulator n=2 Tax=Terribacillus saccharophilus TaxID=361277 RepID=A0ABX4H0V0_9BACI|nr:Fis family transcriptional regulator [Terribacillus saccharophilus]PAD95046.1 Fis family transcriptional regulator [Terribacillus saccharophilus]PAE00763.1 Fis family transcriptional regulator [Terribacillus saccharophilus]